MRATMSEVRQKTVAFASITRSSGEKEGTASMFSSVVNVINTCVHMPVPAGWMNGGCYPRVMIN